MHAHGQFARERLFFTCLCKCDFIQEHSRGSRDSRAREGNRSGLSDSGCQAALGLRSREMHFRGGYSGLASSPSLGFQTTQASRIFLSKVEFLELEFHSL